MSEYRGANPRSIDGEVQGTDSDFRSEAVQLAQDLAEADKVLEMMDTEGYGVFVNTFSYRLERCKEELTTAHDALRISSLQGEIRALKQLVTWETEVRNTVEEARIRLHRMQEMNKQREEVWANG